MKRRELIGRGTLVLLLGRAQIASGAWILSWIAKVAALRIGPSSATG